LCQRPKTVLRPGCTGQFHDTHNPNEVNRIAAAGRSRATRQSARLRSGSAQRRAGLVSGWPTLVHGRPVPSNQSQGCRGADRWER